MALILKFSFDSVRDMYSGAQPEQLCIFLFTPLHSGRDPSVIFKKKLISSETSACFRFSEPCTA